LRGSLVSTTTAKCRRTGGRPRHIGMGYLAGRVVPKLFGEPFAEAGFNFFLCDGAIHPGIFQPSSYFVQDIEMILDVFHRAACGGAVPRLVWWCS
jgi:hypothetical protein